jgi:hypothetical protein
VAVGGSGSGWVAVDVVRVAVDVAVGGCGSGWQWVGWTVDGWQGGSGCGRVAVDVAVDGSGSG